MAGYGAAAESNFWELEINGIAGRLCHLRISKEMPMLRIEDIKKSIEDTIAVPVLEQRLFLGPCELIKAADLQHCENPVELTLLRRTPEQVHWLKEVRKDGKRFATAPPEVHRDKEIIQNALHQDWRLLKHVPADLKEEIDVIEAALENRAPAARVLHCAAKKSKRLARVAVRYDGCSLQHFDPEVMDKDIVLAAVAQYPSVIEFLPCCYRQDWDVLLSAVAQDGTCLSYASEELQGDRDLVLAAVRQEGMALEYASESLKADAWVVLEAVRLDGCALQFASEALRADPKVLVEAVHCDGLAFEFADAKMKDTKDFVLLAIHSDPRAIRFTSLQFRTDPDVIMAALSRALRGFGRESDREEDRASMLAEVTSYIGAGILLELRRNYGPNDFEAKILDHALAQDLDELGAEPGDSGLDR